jgi:hypothetical protein
MITKWVVSTYHVLISILLWIAVIAGGICGAALAVGLLEAGWLMGSLSFLLGCVIAFFAAAVFLGAFLVLDDIRSAVRTIQKSQA